MEDLRIVISVFLSGFLISGAIIVSCGLIFRFVYSRYKAELEIKLQGRISHAEVMEHKAKRLSEIARNKDKEIERLKSAIEFALKNYLDIPCEKSIPDGILTTGRIVLKQALSHSNESREDEKER